MTKKIVIIGAGPGGYVAAVRAARMGGQVTLVEKDTVGGTCLNRGCIPSKVMHTTASFMDELHRARTLAVAIEGGCDLDMAGLMERKDKVVQAQVRGIRGLLKQNGVELVSGAAYISGPGSLDVTGGDGTATCLEWDRLILATGSSPLEVPSLAFDHQQILSSDDIFTLKELPPSMVIVGGGVIGCEFASIFASLGTRITLVEALDRLLPLPSVDADSSKVLLREMKKKKIKVYLQHTVDTIQTGEDDLLVTISPLKKGGQASRTEPINVRAAKVLVCIGRQPNSAGLGLENLGVECDRRGWIMANARMQTSVEGVYAIGDALGPEKVMLAHVASAEAEVAAANAMGGNAAMNYNAVPGAVFTLPEVADVGLTAARAAEQGIEAGEATVLFRVLGKAQAMGHLAGQAKIVWEKDSRRVLGVHLIGAHATDLIAEGTLAVANGLTVDDLARTIHAHPTLAEAMAEVSFKALGDPLHG